MNGINGIAHPTFHSGDAHWLAQAVKALADPTRLRIVAHLAQREDATGVQIEEMIGTLKQPTISHHLRILRLAGLISRDQPQRGWLAYWSLNRESLRAVLDLLQPGGGQP